MRFLVIAIAFAASSAMADTGLTPTPARAPSAIDGPRSVWRPRDDGAVEHLESGLVCPARIGPYVRTELQVYDHLGLDVSCNYAASDRDITIYLTRKSAAGVEEAMAEAKRELVQYRAQLNPKLASEGHSADGGLDWRNAVYAVDVDRHSAVWLAELDGWLLEYRATYPADAELGALDDLSAMTRIVQGSAGSRLALCAKSPSPERPGVAVTGKKALSDAAMMEAILGGAAAAMASDPRTAVADEPVTWCVDQPILGADPPLLLWRAVSKDGADAKDDQITTPSAAEPMTLNVSLDSLADLVEAANGKPNGRWVAKLDRNGQTWVFGYFTARPNAELLAALYRQIVAGTAKPLIGYGAKGKNVTISTPP